MTYYEKSMAQYGDYLYVVFRALIGVMFLLHGWMKFTAGIAHGLMLAAAIIEVVAGAAILLGLFTRLVATIAALEMLIAFFTVHFPSGLNPLANQGEPAVLFFAAFLVLIVYGSRKWSLEKALLKKQVF